MENVPCGEEIGASPPTKDATTLMKSTPGTGRGIRARSKTGDESHQIGLVLRQSPQSIHTSYSRGDAVGDEVGDVNAIQGKERKEGDNDQFAEPLPKPPSTPGRAIPNPLTRSSPNVASIKTSAEETGQDKTTPSMAERLRRFVHARKGATEVATRLATGPPTLSFSLPDITSTPRIQKINGKKVRDLHSIFTVRNNFGYILKSFHNRESVYVPWRGFSDSNEKKFVKFEDEDMERLNFLHSKLGDLATPIDENMEYSIFGVKSYLKVNRCMNCKKSKPCYEDHHLQVLINDIEFNKDITKDINARDINLKRDFNLVSQNPFPIFNKHHKSSDNLEPNLIYVPTNEGQARFLTMSKMNLTDDQISSLNFIYFPNGEIRGDQANGFDFKLSESLPEGSVILKICLILSHVNKCDALQALECLMVSGEPKEIFSNGVQVQTLKASAYALYCLFINLKQRRCTGLDELFEKNKLFLRDFSELNFGKIKEGLIPLGLILILIRLHVELQIFEIIDKMIINFDENSIPGIVMTNGKLHVKGKSVADIASLVSHESFPPLNSDLNAILSEFYFNAESVFKTLKSEEIKEMGLPTDILTSLSNLIEKEEKLFLHKKGLMSMDTELDVDSVENLVLGMFNDEALNDVIIPPKHVPFDVFHDSQAMSDFIPPDIVIKRKSVHADTEFDSDMNRLAAEKKKSLSDKKKNLSDSKKKDLSNINDQSSEKNGQMSHDDICLSDDNNVLSIEQDSGEIVHDSSNSSVSVCLSDRVTDNDVTGRAEDKSKTKTESVIYESLSHRGKQVLARDLKAQFEDVENGVDEKFLFPPKPPSPQTPLLSALAAFRVPSPPPFNLAPVVTDCSSAIYTQIACTSTSVHAQPAIGVLSVNSAKSSQTASLSQPRPFLPPLPPQCPLPPLPPQVVLPPPTSFPPEVALPPHNLLPPPRVPLETSQATRSVSSTFDSPFVSSVVVSSVSLPLYMTTCNSTQPIYSLVAPPKPPRYSIVTQIERPPRYSTIFEENEGERESGHDLESLRGQNVNAVDNGCGRRNDDVHVTNAIIDKSRGQGAIPKTVKHGVLMRKEKEIIPHYNDISKVIERKNQKKEKET